MSVQAEDVRIDADIQALEDKQLLALFGLGKQMLSASQLHPSLPKLTQCKLRLAMFEAEKERRGL